MLPLLQQEFERLADEGTCIHQYVLRLQDKVREARLRGQHSEYLDLLSSLLAAVSMERHTASGSEPASAAVGEWVSRWWAKICELGILQVSEAAGSAPLIVLSTQATEDEAGQEEEERGLQSRCGGMQDEEEERFFGVDVLRDRRGSSGDDENSGSESWESEAERVREMYEGSDARERAPSGEVDSALSSSSRKRRYLEVVGQSLSSSSRLAPLRLFLPAWLPDDFEVNCVRVVQGYVEEASSTSAAPVAHLYSERERDPAAGTQE